MLERMWTNLDRPPLDVRALRRALVDGPQASWSRVDVVTETGSTNADLIAGAANYADRTALIAEHQDSGRGRHARPFSGAPRSQILVSMLLKFPGIDPSVLGWVSLMTGIALVDALRTVGEVDARLKWPNDVLIGGKKVSGILAEVAAHGPSPTVVIGLGVNVSMTVDELPVPTATSLALEGAAVLDRDTLVRAILGWPPRWTRGGTRTGTPMHSPTGTGSGAAPSGNACESICPAATRRSEPRSTSTSTAAS
jgi:BirA family biotin operon repressor/biotin-[acetyl-CoA-carboxylase] ligase